jgi:dephospho-CoA kinase
MSEPLKIAITGKLRSGKDTAARYLMTDHGFDVPISFGAALKRIYHELFPWIPADRKPREGYQKLGQLIREHFDEDVWIKHAERMVEFSLDKRYINGVVISDLRQPNEYDWARKNGFIIARITAPDELRIERARLAGDEFSADNLAHETEQFVDGFEVDYELHNDGDYRGLFAQIDDMIRDIRRKGAIE